VERLVTESQPVNGQILEIRFRQNGEPFRKVISRSATRSRTKYASWKMGRHIQADSTADVPIMLELDTDYQVTAFNEQPCLIRYSLGGIEHAHYPDLLAEYDDKRVLIEVKRVSDELDEAIHERTRLMAQELPKFGFEYQLRLADPLRATTRMANARELLRWGRAPVSTIEFDRIRKKFDVRARVSWKNICAWSRRGLYRRIASRLVLEGAIRVDLEAPMSDWNLQWAGRA
jgi:hypothetical protein